MRLQYYFVLLVLGWWCDGQALQEGSFFLPSNWGPLTQSVLPAAKGLSSQLADKVFQVQPPFQGSQQWSSSQLFPGNLVQMVPSVENSNQASLVKPMFEATYGLSSGQISPVQREGQSTHRQAPRLVSSMIQPSHRQASAKIPLLRPVLQAQSQPSMLASPVHPGVQVSPSVNSQWLFTTPGVKVECREDLVLVEVQQDMLGTGQLIQPSEVTLGSCAPTAQDPSTGVLIFVSELQGCGSTVMMTDSLVYGFVLTYMPKGIGSTPVVRSHGAVINIECHYVRRYNVSSNAVTPTWVPYAANMFAEERLVFSLRLMSDNWQLQRASNIYFLGDILNIEASVVVADHQPLRLFVDSCVATLNPDVTSVPRYVFVENHGCLTDAKVMGSRSQFLPRKQDNMLQLQLDAFRFSQESRNSIYITCILKATMVSKRTDAQHKACSHSVAANRWTAVDGNDQVCSCCDGTCSFRKGRNVADFKGEAAIGPIFIQNPSYRLS